MKPIQLTVAILIALCSCKKEPPAGGASGADKGVSKAFLNGSLWEPQFSGGAFARRPLGGYDSSVFGYGANILVNGLRLQELSFGKIPLVPGRYAVRSSFLLGPDTVVALFSLNHGDQPLARYSVLNSPSEENYLQVDAYNPASFEVTGRFQATFLHDSLGKPTGVSGFGDTVRFTEGSFRVTLGG